MKFYYKRRIFIFWEEKPNFGDLLPMIIPLDLYLSNFSLFPLDGLIWELSSMQFFGLQS